MEISCPTCGEKVRDVGLVAYFNLNGTPHMDCFWKTHRIVWVSEDQAKVVAS